MVRGDENGLGERSQVDHLTGLTNILEMYIEGRDLKTMTSDTIHSEGKKVISTLVNLMTPVIGKPTKNTSGGPPNIRLDISLYMPIMPGNHRHDNRAQSSLAASKLFNPTIVAGTASTSSPAMEDRDRATSQEKKKKVSREKGQKLAMYYYL